jgi:hypothetical protein
MSGGEIISFIAMLYNRFSICYYLQQGARGREREERNQRGASITVSKTRESEGESEQERGMRHRANGKTFGPKRPNWLSE